MNYFIVNALLDINNRW